MPNDTIPLPQPDAYEYLIADVWRTQTHWNGVKASAYRCLYATEKVHAHAAAVSAADNAALREHLGNLLAVLHGDGGHYEAEHGTDKAVADALTRFYSNIMAADSKITAKDERIKVLEDAIQHYEAALKARWPEGAKGESFGHWNAARAALGDKT